LAKNTTMVGVSVFKFKLNQSKKNRKSSQNRILSNDVCENSLDWISKHFFKIKLNQTA